MKAYKTIENRVNEYSKDSNCSFYDGDGYSNCVEFGEGSDPTDPKSIPQGDTWFAKRKAAMYGKLKKGATYLAMGAFVCNTLAAPLYAKEAKKYNANLKPRLIAEYNVDNNIEKKIEENDNLKSIDTKTNQKIQEPVEEYTVEKNYNEKRPEISKEKPFWENWEFWAAAGFSVATVIVSNCIKSEPKTGTNQNNNNNQPTVDDYKTDKDSDGMLDYQEMKYFGNLNQTASGDYDKDGYSNKQEMDEGSDPSDPKSIPQDNTWFVVAKKYQAAKMNAAGTNLKSKVNVNPQNGEVYFVVPVGNNIIFDGKASLFKEDFKINLRIAF